MAVAREATRPWILRLLPSMTTCSVRKEEALRSLVSEGWTRRPGRVEASAAGRTSAVGAIVDLARYWLSAKGSVSWGEVRCMGGHRASYTAGASDSERASDACVRVCQRAGGWADGWALPFGAHRGRRLCFAMRAKAAATSSAWRWSNADRRCQPLLSSTHRHTRLTLPHQHNKKKVETSSGIADDSQASKPMAPLPNPALTVSYGTHRRHAGFVHESDA